MIPREYNRVKETMIFATRHYRTDSWHYRPNAKRSLQGFGMLEAIVAVMISISLMAIGSRYISQQADSALNQATARQLNQLSLAANHYAHDHFEQLQTETKEGQWVEWQRPEIQRYLIDKGYLPDTLPGKNPYQQQYRIIIQQPELQLLQIVTLTQAGKAIKESSLRQIAQVAGPNSGFISHLNPQQVMGSQGGWELPAINRHFTDSSRSLGSVTLSEC